MNKRQWLTLGIVGTALALLPRRSSRQATLNANNESETDDIKTKKPQSKSFKSKDSKDKNSKDKGSKDKGSKDKDLG